jgi:hypothetical protein
MTEKERLNNITDKIIDDAIEAGWDLPHHKKKWWAKAHPTFLRSVFL